MEFKKVDDYIDKVAERDYKSYASVEELNFLRDAINNSRIE